VFGGSSAVPLHIYSQRFPKLSSGRTLAMTASIPWRPTIPNCSYVAVRHVAADLRNPKSNPRLHRLFELTRTTGLRTAPEPHTINWPRHVRSLHTCGLVTVALTFTYSQPSFILGGVRGRSHIIFLYFCGASSRILVQGVPVMKMASARVPYHACVQYDV
jgi:hypothetical protein